MQRPSLSPDEVEARAFSTSFRGLDPAEVRAFLAHVAEHLRTVDQRVAELTEQLADAERRAASPTLDVDTVTKVLGEETARILKSAQEAAHDIRAKAEENIAQLLREAHEDASRIRAEAELVLARETEAAEEAAARIRSSAEADADASLARARQEAEHLLGEVEAKARAAVEEAQASRERVLGDLARRRKLAHTQVEQLRAGRERLLEAYRVVRTTLDEVTDELLRAEDEARQAAEEAGRKREAEPPSEPAVEPEPEPEPEPVVEAEPEPVVEADPEPVAEAEVVAQRDVPPPEPEPDPEPAEERLSSGVRIIRGLKEMAPEAEPEPQEEEEPVVADADEAVLQQRDKAVEDVEQRLARRLKRALQDEQNDVLDRLRVLKGRPTAEAVLPPADEHAARYREVAGALLAEAADAGARFADAGADVKVDVGDLAGGLAGDLSEALRRRLDRGFVEGADEDPGLLVERVGAAYRESRARIEQVAVDHVIAAFSRGTTTASAGRSALRWVVDDGGGPCPDCDDNALAGPVSAGEEFPTGQRHPPAHTGCRCLVVPADL